MNGQVEFEYGVYYYTVEYIASVEYDEGDDWTPPTFDWDVNDDDLVITRTDEDNNEEEIDVKVCDDEFLTYLHSVIGDDIHETFYN